MAVGEYESPAYLQEQKDLSTVRFKYNYYFFNIRSLKVSAEIVYFITCSKSEVFSLSLMRLIRDCSEFDVRINYWAKYKNLTFAPSFQSS